MLYMRWILKFANDENIEHYVFIEYTSKKLDLYPPKNCNRYMYACICRAVVHPLLSKYAMHGMVHKENASNRESFLKVRLILYCLQWI